MFSLRGMPALLMMIDGFTPVMAGVSRSIAKEPAPGTSTTTNGASYTEANGFMAVTL